uniref:Immunoglobulin V-set domain-containing protein n=1 Tax=Electrophorus electricus TaxID=8005 RepID=A0A4W4H8U2_ELEEL
MLKGLEKHVLQHEHGCATWCVEQCHQLFMCPCRLCPGDVNPVVNLTGVVEGSVRLHCLFSKNETIVRIYFQKKVENEEQIFIIGYDSKKPLEVPEKYRNRCSMDKQAATMELSQLTLADEGVYFCITFSYTQNALFVIFCYTIPGFSGSLPSCTVTCSSSGGYPWSNVGWAVDGGNPGDVLRVAGNTSEQDPHSHLWNVSQNATLNCTRPVNVTCVVGGSISSPITLCAYDALAASTQKASAYFSRRRCLPVCPKPYDVIEKKTNNRLCATCHARGSQ